MVSIHVVTKCHAYGIVILKSVIFQNKPAIINIEKTFHSVYTFFYVLWQLYLLLLVCLARFIYLTAQYFLLYNCRNVNCQFLLVKSIHEQ